MELMEPVGPGELGWDDAKCPFPHDAAKKPKERENVIPPPKELNSSKKLEGAIKARTGSWPSPKLGKRTFGASAHHLIPGNESLKHSRLVAWMDESVRSTKVQGNIGFDINHHRNGRAVPSSRGVDGWDAEGEAWQREYALAAMEAAGGQFHDRHPAYSAWVLAYLDKIATKLDEIAGPDGCGKDGCCGAKRGRKKPFAPLDLLERLDALEDWLGQRVTGAPASWRRPLFLSRFACFISMRVKTVDDASALLSEWNRSLAGGG